jgi:hypothetical protein
MTRQSENSAAIFPCSGRFLVSRSPAEPKTLIILPPVPLSRSRNGGKIALKDEGVCA